MTLYVREEIDYRGNSPRYRLREATEREVLVEVVERFTRACDECDGTGTGANGGTCFLCSGLRRSGIEGSTLIVDSGEAYPNRGDLVLWSDLILSCLREEQR